MITAEVEVLPHGHVAEKFPRLRALYYAIPSDGARRYPVQTPTAKSNLARVGDQSRNRIEKRGLAGAVQSDYGDELAFVHVEANSLECLCFAIVNADPGYLKQTLLPVFDLVAVFCAFKL